ncbi:MAG: AAA family ATPase [Pirellulales bacterium]
MHDTVPASQVASVAEYADRLAFLRRPDVYPDQPLQVEAIETHISWVFLTRRYAYKLKKPVSFGFIDFSTVERRQAACQNEIRVNRRLAPHVYLGITPITFDRHGRRCLGGHGEVDDWLVQMRRLPADRALDQLLAAGTFTPRDVTLLAERLVEFYSSLPPLSLKTADFRAAIERHVRDNLTTLLTARPACSPLLVRRTHAAQLRLLALHPAWWDERVCDGRVVEGHGDLRPEHIYFVPRPVIIDAIEFNDELRRVDVLDELSFLAMECGCRGVPAVGRQIRDHYCAATRDQPPRLLPSFYEAYRACVRAKVAVLRAGQQAEAAAACSRRAALRYLEWAEETLVSSVRPLVLAVCGPSGSGKSTLAGALAESLGAELLQTDRLRQRVPAQDTAAGSRYGQGSYSTEQRGAIYQQMAQQVGELLRQNVTVVLDGTFLLQAYRHLVEEAAARAGAALCYVRCGCPTELRRSRVVERLRSETTLSDMRPEWLLDQEREADPWPASDRLLTVDTTQSVAALVAQVMRFLGPLLE